MYSNYISQNQLAKIDRITAFKFQGWNALDNSHLILSSSFRKNYLIKLDGYCPDLSFTPNIFIDQKQEHVLSAFFDSIIIPQNHNYSCRINSIYPITKDQTNELLEQKSKTL